MPVKLVQFSSQASGHGQFLAFTMLVVDGSYSHAPEILLFSVLLVESGGFSSHAS